LGNLPLYHMDAYRLEYSEEDIGFDEYFEAEGVSIIEWASFISDFLPEERLEINIKKVSETERVLQSTAKGTDYEDILEQLAGVKGEESNEYASYRYVQSNAWSSYKEKQSNCCTTDNLSKKRSLQPVNACD